MSTSAEVEAPGVQQAGAPGAGVRVTQPRAPGDIRRHWSRDMVRVSVLVAVDLTSLLILRTVVGAARAGELGQLVASRVNALFPQGFLGGWQFFVAVVLALVIAGAYGAGDRRGDTGRMLYACALAGLIALYSALWTEPLALVLTQYAGTVIALSTVLVIGRTLVDRIGRTVTGYRLIALPADSIGHELGGAPGPATADFLAQHIPSGEPTHILGDGDARLVSSEMVGEARVIVNTRRLNDIRYLNRFLLGVNSCLPEGGWFALRLQTLEQRRAALSRRSPRLSLPFVLAIDFLMNRLAPKLAGSKRLYFAISKGRGRAISKCEALGRLAYCGFEIVDTAEVDEILHVVARKTHEPSCDSDPSYGPFCKILRVGRGGKPVYTYKLRTMHPYAEYLQDYVYKQNHLAEGGKFNGDFRVTRWSRVLRRLWLDEIPMLLNWVKGDLKLVGVRPLTQHYLSLYPEHFRRYRLHFKPGLVPPYYADLPSTLEEIIRSEETYLNAYERRPLRTDCRYFLRALYNIVFKGARSR